MFRNSQLTFCQSSDSTSYILGQVKTGQTVCNPDTSSTAQGGGGSFKNRKRIGEIDCCE